MNFLQWGLMTALVCTLPVLLSGQSYNVSQSGTYNIEIDNPTYFSSNGDEISQIPIGFNFEFFGNTYTDCYVGGDGFVTFSSDPYMYCCGQSIPDAAGPNNLIALAWTNGDFVSTHYELFGSAPNRRLVITLDLGNPCDSSYYGQVKLFESTNIIEIHTQQWYGGECQGWNVTQGIENTAGTVAYAVPGRNYNDIWQVLPGENDFVSFTPGEPFEYLMQEVDNDYNLIFNVPEDITIYEDTLEAVPIGFDFEFFGNPYDSVYISANGFITFDNTMNPGCCEGQLIPTSSSPNNLIAAAWTDAYGAFGQSPYYNIYSYETIGNAPDRTFVVTFDYYDECNNSHYYGQIHLLESDFSIEIHTQNWAQFGDPCNPTTQGIENNTGSQAYFIPERNANSVWEVTCCSGDMVRFIPLSSLPQADAGVSHIYNEPYCEGSPMMRLLIRNFGGADIDSVQVHWTWNGVAQDSVPCNFPMPVGDTHFYVELDTQNVVYGETYELKAWTSMPNGLSDDNVTNDTMTVAITVGMEGSYTIGGTSPDFNSIQEAVDSLQSIGICDTVTMLIRPGTYNEQIILPYIPGSFGKQIIFTAENGDSTSVVVEYNATHEDSNYVVMFDNTFEITWEKMTVNALGTIQAVVFELRNYSTYNTIQHCSINGKVTTSNSYNFACIFSRAQNNDNTISYNTMSNGSFGYFHEIIPPGIMIGLQENTDKSRGSGSGDPEDYVERTQINGNTFLNFAKSAIRTTLTKGMQIHDNYMESAQTNVWAMHITEDLDTLSISNNIVYVPNGQYALHLSNVDPPTGYRASIFNNMFNVPGSNSTIIGTGLYNVNDLDFFQNTIRIHNNSVNAYPFYHSGGSIDSVYNNIFANTGNGPAIYINSNFLNHYDYNNYHTHGSVLGTFGSSTFNAPDIATWQAYTGFDDHSTAYNPLFVADTNLHVRASLLNGRGSPLHSSETDIDGETRDELTPDPGGDEFEPVATDVAITQVLSPVLSCEAEQNIEVVLANVGADTLESVHIHWSLNGLPQDDNLFSLSLLPEGDTAHLIIGLNNFSSFHTDTLVIWTTMPNGVTDLQPENDTLEIRFRLPLSGPYTIGGPTPDFASIAEAVNALNTFHTCGPVTFRIRDGVYTEQIAIDSIPTTSSTNTITFESESLDSSAVTIQFTPLNSTKPAVFLLKGTDYVIFRHLGFKALPSSYSDVLELRYSADHITVTNCHFEGYHFGSSSVLIKCLNFGGGSDTITIENSYFLNGQQAIYLYNGGIRQHEVNIEQNTFVNQRFGSIDVSFTRGLYLRNNNFTSNTTISSFKAIDLSSSDTYTDISGNAISLSSAGSGMFLDGLNYSTNPGTAHVYNNMIRCAGTGLGLGIWNGEHVFASYNNIYASGSGPAIELAGGDSLYVQNNVLTSNTGRAFSSFSVTPYAVSDYNDLYSISGNLGYWNGILYPTFAEWQTGTTFDSNSINIDPEFVSDTDLHVLADTLDGAGIPIAGISEDFDGNPRNALMPDIGADEIGANDDDAGVLAILPEMPFARGTQDVKAIVRNYGGNTITSVDIHWILNNIPQPPITYTGSLPSLQEDTITLGTVVFLLSTPYTIKSWTSDPNSNADLYPGNDTLLTSARYAAVSDTVTIGGASPDVPTLAAALTALSFGGVLDSVHFQLRNGTYHATLTLPQTAGMNCNTPIIFESESGNAGDVVWDNQSLTTSTVILDGADGITFRNLTIKTVQSNLPAVHFKNGAHCNTFEGCILEGMTTTNSSTSMATVYSHGSQNNNNTFFGNTIKKGSYGIYWDGGYSTTGARVENNTVQDAYYSGITLANNLAPTIHQNTITTTSGIHYFYGIYLYNCSHHARVTSNQILIPGIRGVGILMSICNGNVSQPSLVANNFILMGSGTSSYGIQHYYCSWSNLYFNTIRITGGATSGFPYYRTYATNVNIKNNIFDNRAGGVAMHIGANEGPLVCDFNDLYSNGIHLVHYNGTNYTDLEGWQASNFDTSSISLDPMYISNTGYSVTNAALNAAATPLDSVTTDIEGMTRDTLTPDIGCDEFEPFNDDVGILSINYPNEPFPSGLNTVFIKFSNNGLDTLTSMQVDWEVDSIVQPTYIWTGLLPSAGTYDSLDIGEFDFEPYRTHTIKVWVSQPNGMMDELSINDTLVVDSLYPALEGIYTIGGVDPDFDSLSIATDVLNAGGASGPVTFNIRTGTYLETINLTDYPGSDCARPVIFQSESGDSTDVIITNLGINDNIVTLNGTDGVIFKYLTLQSVNPSYRNVVEYYNGAHCNQFLNNHLEGYENNSTDFNHAVIRSGTSLDTANRFAYNWIENGSAAFYLVGNGSSSNTVIEHNLLERNFYHGIYASSESKINILGNEILGSTASYYRGIYLEYCHGANRIEGNDLRCNSTDNIIRLETCHGTSGIRPRIINNFFSTNGTAGSNAVMINNCKRYDVFNNNISLQSTSPSTAFYFHTDSSLHLVNNIVVNNGAGQILYGNNQTAFVSDYNNYFGTGSFGTWNNGGVADLEAWQIATNQESHSLNINPQYMSGSDLHISNILLNGVGQYLASVTIDIDGDARDSMPDIGADEFDPSIANDAGVFMYLGPNAPFAHGTQPVTVALKNYGYETMTSADIRWLVNGIEQPVYHWTGSLGSALCDTVVIGNLSFAEYKDHDFILWSEFPNGVPDSTHVNDTLAIDDQYPALSGTYTVGGVLPNFNLFIQLENALNKGGILNNVTFDIRPGTYNTQLVVHNFPRTNYIHQVIFQSEGRDSSLVNIRRNFANVNNYTIQLSNAHNIVFRDLTLSTTQGRIVDIANESSKIDINHCRLTGVDIPYISGGHQLLYSSTTTEDTIHISSNRFEEGDYGIYLTASGGNLEKEVSIIDNYFYNVRYRSIHTHNHDGLTITGNTIFNNQSDHEGIAITASANTKSISGNDIRQLAGGNHGLYLHYVSGSSGSPTPINNNYIYITGWPYNSVGIQHSNGNYNQFNYNTVRLENTGSGSIGFIDYSSNYNIHLRNCNFANYSGGLSMYAVWYPFYTNNTTDYCNLYTTGSVLARYAYDYATLQDLQTGVNQNLNGVSAEPLFATEAPDVFQAALDSAAISIAGISVDIDGTSRNTTTPDIGAKEFTLLAHDVGAKLLVSPETYCGLSNAEDITIRVQNYGSSFETGFDVAYSMNGAGWTVENVGALTVSPGGVLDYTFTTSEDMSQVGTYNFILRTSLSGDLNISNDTVSDIAVEHIPALTQPVSNMIPDDGQINLESTVSLSWAPAPNATLYDLYVWKAIDPEPLTPQVPNLSQINTLYYSLEYGTTYNWRVIAKNVCDQMVSGPVQDFTIRQLPNLQLDTVIAPATAFSGQIIEIEWEVSNSGPGSSQSTLWSDAVYLSTDATLNTSFDTYLGAVQNLTALDSSIAYTNTGEFTVPNGFAGDFYVFVYADRWNNLPETNNNNNWERTNTPMMITLSPSPDLVVDEVTIPGSAFSGQQIQVTFSIRNNGLGSTDAMIWRDLISIGTSPVSSGGGFPLTNVIHSISLEPDSIYEVTATVTLPQNVSGNHYIYIHTDYLNQQYEFGAENNNTLISDTLEIFLTPPPDLVPVNITFPDTVSSNEVLNVSWTVQNAGATSPTSSYWYDRIDLSPSPIYNNNFNTPLTSSSHAPPLSPDSSYIKTKSVTIPVSANGTQYMYISTDINNNVFEYTYESNNTLRKEVAIYVASPELKPALLTHVPSAMSGATIPVSYKMINAGLGDLVSRSYADKIYLSQDQTIGQSDIELSNIQYGSVSLGAGDTLSRVVNVTLPLSASGPYYIIVKVDVTSQVFENGIENNNTLADVIAMDIFLSPWPDLIPQNIILDDTVAAGNLTPLSYEILNQGAGNAADLGYDGIYFSSSSTWNPLLATKIVSIDNSGTLAPDSVHINSQFLLLPSNIISNVYYFYVWSDEQNTVFENSMNGNNIQRSGPVFILGFPPVDLRIDTLYTVQDTLYSGLPLSPDYIVHNAGDDDLISNSWVDKGYLSVDSILDYSLDLAIGSINVQTTGIASGNSLPFQPSFTIPNGLSGDYYFIVEVDVNDQNEDINRNNNHDLLRDGAGVARKIHITLSPYPDLRLQAFNAPAIAIAGQPAAFAWETKNTGTGPATQWIEKIYLSANNTIGNGDVLLYTQTSSNLPATDTLLSDTSVFLPVWAIGNYFLILQTDANNQLYEHNGENNNTLLRSIEITSPPPSDLIVSDIAVPDNVLAGDTATISWNTSNTGAYVASGQLREIVYLSADPILDIADEIFAIRDGAVFLPPLSTNASTHTASVLGIGVGDYYALVQTDARDNILESSNGNNVTSSIDLMNVDVKQLYLDSLTLDTLVNNKELYYKIEIPASNEGLNLLVRLSGDTLESSNELFARYGTVPSRAEFDIGFDRPFHSYQEFVIRNIQPGTYYIMSYGLHDTASQQPVTLYARLVTYSLISVSPVRGGNEGFTTLTLKGSSLDSTTEVRLIDTLFNYHLADTFTIIDDGTIVARFDLRGVTPGVYTVQSVRPEENLGELIDAFTVIEGGGADLQVTYTFSPEAFFANTPVTKLIVEGINNGDNDLENAGFRIESVLGSQLSLNFADYLSNITTNSISVPIQINNGFEGVLAPGQTVRYEFPMRTSPYPLASIAVTENE